jgi:hypothetical protein
MKMKIGVAILAVVCAGLVVALIATRHQADARQAESADTILQFSNELDKAHISLNDLSQVNLTLNNDLATNRDILAAVSNNLVEISGALDETKTSLQNAQGQITTLDARVADLEAQNQALDRRAADLTNTIAGLSAQITDTQTKLVTSETNTAFLEGELKRQVAEKNELQRKFDDLATVRTQVKKLRDDAVTARRLEWMREGIDPTRIPKGGELLMQHTAPPTNNAAATPKAQDKNDKIPPPLGPNFNLNVEVGSDGSVHVIPAMPSTPGATNSP